MMWLNKFSIFCVIVLFFFDFVGGLKTSDDGVCVVKVSTRKTRIRMVTINKWCGKKKCQVKKVEPYTTQQEKVLCCKGWEYDVNTDKCGPVCSTGCTGGRCIAPEVCQCDPPAFLDPEHKNSCIQPQCDPPCVNAQCNMGNVCSCHSEYTKYNSTHCFKCESGYTLSEDFSCSPICNTTCINSKCTAPDTCTCLEGYNSVEKNICEPECDVCVNSTCTAPNTCSCLDGFEKVNDTTCAPKCKECDGDCVGPNMCNCRAGYENVNGTCKPMCACVNGVCKDGECSCNEGFKKDENNSSVCVRSCDRPYEVESRLVILF